MHQRPSWRLCSTQGLGDSNLGGECAWRIECRIEGQMSASFRELGGIAGKQSNESWKASYILFTGKRHAATDMY